MERIDRFANFFRSKSPKIGDKVLCKKNFKFIKEVSKNDYEYVSNTGDYDHIKDIIKGKTYLFEEGKYYNIIDVSDNSVEIESDVDKWNGKGKDSQIFIFKSYISKYEREYFPIFSDYFTF